MAYAGGYAGGYADAAVVVEPPPVIGSPVWSPTRPARHAVRRQGRATLRLKVTATTWGAEGAHRSRHTAGVALLAPGEATLLVRTTIIGGLRTRHGTASATSRASLRTHMGDPKEDDRLILLAVSALLLGRTP